MKISIKTLLENPKKLIAEDKCKFFYDWFCADYALEQRANRFIPKLKFLVKIGIVDPDKMYVWFKNNCPLYGTIYDDMRFSLLESEDFCGGICPKTGHINQELKAQLWYFDKDKKIKYVNASDWSELKKQLKTDPELVKQIRESWLNDAI